MTNLQKPIRKFFKQIENKAIVERAKERFAYKPFYENYRSLYANALIARYLFHLFSILTAVTFVSVLLLNILPEIAALAVAALLLTLWEVGKGGIIQQFFVAYYGSGKANVALAALGLTFLSGSVFCSIEGAKDFYQMQDKSIANLEATHSSALDSINSFYTAKVATMQSKIGALEALKPKRWGGLLSASENKMILNYQQQIEQMEVQRAAELAAAKERQGNELLLASEGKEFNTLAFALLTGTNEALILLIGWFLVYFDYRTAKEADLMNGGQPIEFSIPTIKKLLEVATSATSDGGQVLTVPIGKGAGPGKIGFQTGANTSTSKNDKQSSDTILNQVHADAQKEKERELRAFLAKYEHVVECVKDGVSNSKTAKQCDVSLSTVHNVKRCLRTLEAMQS